MDIDISPIEVKVFVSERENIMIFSQEGLRFVNNHLLLHSAWWLDKFDEPQPKLMTFSSMKYLRQWAMVMVRGAVV
jgi:hypothetical protein